MPRPYRKERSFDTPFIRKITLILNCQRFQAAIGWDETGTMIDINNIKKLEEEVLPKYFRHAKFESFIRQLNLYGFRKIKKAYGDYSQRFHHHSFTRPNATIQKNSPQIKQQNQERTTFTSIMNTPNREQEEIQNNSKKTSINSILKVEAQPQSQMINYSEFEDRYSIACNYLKNAERNSYMQMRNGNSYYDPAIYSIPNRWGFESCFYQVPNQPVQAPWNRNILNNSFGFQ